MSLIYAGLAVAALTLLIGGFLVWKGKLEIRNPIRAFAVLCVAVIATYLMWFGFVLTETLRSPRWCATALGAEKASADGKTQDGLKACIELLQIQLNSLALNSHINLGALAACLVVLIVIVIAGARLDAAISKGNLNFNLSREEEKKAAAAAGAAQAASAAVDEAKDIATGAAPVADPAPQPSGKFTAPPGEEL